MSVGLLNASLISYSACLLESFRRILSMMLGSASSK
jgi:hypothetical protein